ARSDVHADVPRVEDQVAGLGLVGLDLLGFADLVTARPRHRHAGAIERVEHEARAVERLTLLGSHRTVGHADLRDRGEHRVLLLDAYLGPFGAETDAGHAERAGDDGGGPG